MIGRKLSGTFAALCVVIAMACAPAQAEEIFTVADVEVEATGDSATAARDAAIAQGQMAAFTKLLEQMDPTDGKAKAAKYNATQVANTVRGMEVMNEKMTSKSYKATLKLTFDPDQIRQVLGQAPAGAAASTATATTTAATAPRALPSAVLILPILRRDQSLQLWEEGNQWRTIWNSVALEKGAGQLVVPYGDPNDISVVDAQKAISGGYGLFQPLADRYGAQEVVVTEAIYQPGIRPLKMKVNIRRVGPGYDELTTSIYDGKPEETPEMLLIRAAQEVATDLQKSQAALNDATNEQINRMTVLATISNLRDWIVMRKMLERVPMITDTELAALSFRQADVVLYYRGPAENLAKGMLAQGLRLSPAGQFWAVGLP